MIYLTGGDTYIKYWLTPAFAVAQLPKVHCQDAQCEIVAESGDEDNAAGAHTSSLTNDTVIPFPGEHFLCLTHVCGADLLVDLTLGNGQLSWRT